MLAPFNQIAVAAANEGIPVAAIARITKQALDEVYETLQDAKLTGSLLDIPRADWPPGTRAGARLPSLPLPNDDDLTFACKRKFKLTALEVAFLVTLLKNREVDKTRLHHVVEQQRHERQTQPNKQDETDPKMVDVIICKLRKKLKTIDPGLKIETIWGDGYCIAVDMKPRIVAAAYGEPDAQEAKITNGDPVSAISSERQYPVQGEVVTGALHPVVDRSILDAARAKL